MNSCEICGSEDFSLVATEIREGAGKICQCNSCGLVIQDISQTYEGLDKYYNEEYQLINSLVSGREQSPKEHFDDRIMTIKPIIENIRPYLNPQIKLLEIGCGTGELLYNIKSYVSEVTGVEINSRFVNFINSDLGIEAYAGDINKIDIGGRKFDFIISIATLDHLNNPLETLVTMRDLLAPDGKIYIEVPNRNEGLNHYIPSPNREMFNKFFWHRAHLFYFTKATITALFKKAGLNVSISCRHDYTLKNFLNWYFLGKPQSGLVTGMLDSRFFYGKSDFEVRMEKALSSLEEEFKMIMLQTFCGDNLCCIGWL